MSNNQVAAALAQRGIKVATFARQIGMSQQTLYNVVKKESIDNIGISTFIKIAEGLDMAPEELYYGTSKKQRAFDDPQQEELNGHYESMNATGRKLAVDSIKAMSSSPELRAVKDRRSDTDKPAMEA